MITREGIEGTQLHPASTQFLGCIPFKTTDISTHLYSNQQEGTPLIIITEPHEVVSGVGSTYYLGGRGVL